MQKYWLTQKYFLTLPGVLSVSGHMNKRHMWSCCWDSLSPDVWPVISSAPLSHSQCYKGSGHIHTDSDGPVEWVIEHIKGIIKIKQENAFNLMSHLYAFFLRKTKDFCHPRIFSSSFARTVHNESPKNVYPERKALNQLVNTFGSVPHIDSLFVFKILIFML